MKRLGSIQRVLAAASLLCASEAHAGMLDRLFADRSGGIEPGTYDTADGEHFTLDPLAQQFLFRLNDGREVYVLHTDRASLGGHLLKYDSGGTALSVSGWGGLTLYTDAKPDGLPASREGESVAPAPAPISLADIVGAASDEARHIAYADKVKVIFAADWNTFDVGARALAFDALQNAADGLDRFVSLSGAHDALAKNISQVKLVPAKAAGISLSGKTLVVGIDPTKGYDGRASSREVAESLARLLRVRLAG